MFKRTDSYSRYYGFFLLERLIIGNLIAILFEQYLELLFSVFMFIFLLLYVSIKNPYPLKYNNRRFLANILISLIIASIFLFYNLGDPENIHKEAGIYLPTVICALLLICIIYSSIIIIYEIIMKIRKIKQNADME